MALLIANSWSIDHYYHRFYNPSLTPVLSLLVCFLFFHNIFYGEVYYITTHYTVLLNMKLKPYFFWQNVLCCFLCAKIKFSKYHLSLIPARNVYWNGTLSSGNLLFSLAAVGVTLAVAGKAMGTSSRIILNFSFFIFSATFIFSVLEQNHWPECPCIDKEISEQSYGGERWGL